MNIYSISFKEGEFSTTGIDMMVFSEILISLEKNHHLKTLNELNGLCIITGYNLNFKNIDTENHIAITATGKVKDHSFALVKNNSPFIVENDNQEQMYATISQGKVVMRKNLESLNEAIQIPDLEHLSQEERKAWDWLENGETGISSKTMCHVLYPNLNHYKYEDLTYGYPRDNSDFIRCMKFLDAVPEAKNKLSNLKNIGKEWDNLIDNWDNISTLLKDKKKEEAYYLIKKCIDSPKQKKSQLDVS